MAESRRTESWEVRGSKTRLCALVVEDSEDDALLVVRQLDQHGYETYYERVETPEAMRQALDSKHWDLVLSDHEMHHFSAPEALRILRTKRLDLPFIIVSGKTGEDAAVAAMRIGAHDYVTKDNLARLGPAVKRELSKASERRERRQSEAALRQSEELYRAVVEQSSECIFLVDARSKRLIETNAAFRELLGYTPEELKGMTLYDFVDHDRASVDENVRLIMEKGHHDVGERRYRRKDGTLANVEVQVDTLVLDDREVMCCVSQDITERKRTKNALAQSEERYRAVVEQTVEGSFLFDATTGDILESNVAFQKLLGYTSEELVNTKLYDFVDHDREDIDRRLQIILDEGSHFVGEWRYRRKDGSLVDTEVNANAISYGGREVICTVVRDVTERKRMEDSLRRSLDMLLALHEAGQILGSTLEFEEIGTRLLRIMQRISSLTTAVISVPDEHRPPRVWRAIGFENLWRKARYTPEVQAELTTVLKTGRHRYFELQAPEPDGEQLIGLCLPLRVRDRVIGVLEVYGPEIMIKEDTVEILSSLANQAASALENARLYGELAEREKRLEDLVGKLFVAQEEERRRVAYEVHDGLAQMATSAHQHLQAFARFHPPASADGQKILDRTLKLVQQTVGEARRVIADLRPTALDDFGLQTAIRLEVEALREDGWRIDYESNFDDERLPVAVETALFRIVQQALANIRKHASTKQAHVSLKRPGQRIRLSVRDWGQGFDPATAQSNGGPGEKVGIASMRERVALLNGDFHIRSRPGVGTLVTVDIPLSKQGEDDSEEANPE